ncbi:MAG: FAD-dependent oxidoreductase [Blastocatellia bacterium]|nr:FAD-dependent oxidoreductase [Blastocatellia bacterium]
MLGKFAGMKNQIDILANILADILIVGGSIGGCAAALAASQAGHRVVLTEESDWIGGQFTSQAVPPDEHGWIERFGCTRSYRNFRQRVRAYYHRNYPLTNEARSNKQLNPGNGWVSPLCHEPRVALAVLEEMLAPFVSSGRLTILREHKPMAVDVNGDRIRAVTLRDLRSSNELTITATYILDATELGELLPLSGAEFVTGFESQTMTGEPSAPRDYQPHNQQAFSICFAMSHHDGEDHTIEKPARYDFWRKFVPTLEPAWPGQWLSWTITHPRLMTPLTYHFHPHNESGRAFTGLWSYRRIVDRQQFTFGFDSDVCLVNWPQTDYLLGDLCSGTDEEKAWHLAAAREQSLSLMFWLQTEAQRPDGGFGWKGLRLRGDLTGSPDGLAKMPYIRESRRIQAECTIVEQHVAEALRPNQKFAERYFDSVGIGFYRIDLHPSTGGNNYIDVGSLPFQIPLGALLPVRMENLLPACKNIGTTHITNGCYRLHPVEWNIGEAAGSLAAFCLEQKTSPRAVRQHQLADFQQRLIHQGIELAWPDDLVLAQGDPHIHAQ